MKLPHFEKWQRHSDPKAGTLLIVRCHMEVFIMAPVKCPVTGIDVNPVLVERMALNFDAAVSAWVYRLQGEKYNLIAQRLGTNTHRIGEVFRGEKHPGSKAEAMRRLTH